MAIRIIAVLTLREHYTKTLQIIETHKIISNGIYSIIRHPGYLGVMTFLIGCGLLPGNLISITLIILIVPSFYSKRIKVEEQMLLDNFKEDYEKYMERTYTINSIYLLMIYPIPPDSLILRSIINMDYSAYSAGNNNNSY